LSTDIITNAHLKISGFLFKIGEAAMGSIDSLKNLLQKRRNQPSDPGGPQKNRRNMKWTCICIMHCRSLKLQATPTRNTNQNRVRVWVFPFEFWLWMHFSTQVGV
jgi:hypothetical protein